MLCFVKDVNIRYYEKEGLIHPERKPNGYREYSAEDIQRIRQIKTLRLLDIPIPIIKKVLSEEISLQDVMKNRLLEISEEESRPGCVFPHMKVAPWANTFWKHLICMKHLSIYISYGESAYFSFFMELGFRFLKVFPGKISYGYGEQTGVAEA